MVKFHACDEYATSLPLDCVMNNAVIMGCQMGDAMLLPERGFTFQPGAESKSDINGQSEQQAPNFEIYQL